MISYKDVSKFDQDVTIVFVTKEQVKSKKFAFKNPNLEKEILALNGQQQFDGDQGQVFPLFSQNKLVLLSGLGDASDLTSTALRICVKKSVLSSFVKSRSKMEIVPHLQDDSTVHCIIEGLMLGTYAWKKYKSKDKDERSSAEKEYVIATAHKKIYGDSETICQGANFTRDLINDNADVVNSQFLEAAIKGLIKGEKNISTEILGEKEMKAKGLNLHLAVNQGSQYEPRLIIVKYNGADDDKNYTALVGKGMTFDTGGLNLKTTGHIETMRSDMSGTAAVAGILKNTLNLKIKKNILFTFVIAENAIGSRAFKPGDIYKSYSGKTVEIANTDAEGRLVLADAISYLVKNYKPARIIDIATLTGACVVALGNDYTGLMSTNDDLARELVRASNETDDRVWRLPIYRELKDAVKSQFADIKNLGFSKGAAGALTGAEFLRQFTEGTIWAHLDIAGTAFVDNQERWYFGHGATGASVRLLTNYLRNN